MSSSPKVSLFSLKSFFSNNHSLNIYVMVKLYSYTRIPQQKSNDCWRHFQCLLSLLSFISFTSVVQNLCRMTSFLEIKNSLRISWDNLTANVQVGLRMISGTWICQRRGSLYEIVSNSYGCFTYSCHCFRQLSKFSLKDYNAEKKMYRFCFRSRNNMTKYTIDVQHC